MMKIETKQNRAKQLAQKYNSRISHHIVNMKYWELVELFKKNGFPYGTSSITIMVRDAKLKYDNVSYNSINEPIHWSYFFNLLEQLSKNNSTTRNVTAINKAVKIESNKMEKSENKLDFNDLKELIKKDVSDDIIKKIYPNL